MGNGWTWTSTPFAGFPGFVPTPSYPEYSADFFDGKHYVLLGASWATDAQLARRSFRNWFQPHYPYPFSKFRRVEFQLGIERSDRVDILDAGQFGLLCGTRREDPRDDHPLHGHRGAVDRHRTNTNTERRPSALAEARPQRLSQCEGTRSPAATGGSPMLSLTRTATGTSSGIGARWGGALCARQPAGERRDDHEYREVGDVLRVGDVEAEDRRIEKVASRRHAQHRGEHRRPETPERRRHDHRREEQHRDVRQRNHARQRVGSEPDDRDRGDAREVRSSTGAAPECPLVGHGSDES